MIAFDLMALQELALFELGLLVRSGVTQLVSRLAAADERLPLPVLGGLQYLAEVVDYLAVVFAAFFLASSVGAWQFFGQALATGRRAVPVLRPCPQFRLGTPKFGLWHHLSPLARHLLDPEDHFQV